MPRARVVKGGEWDLGIIERELGVPPLALNPVRSPVITVDDRIEQDATRWLAEVYAKTARTETASGYADSLVGWINYLLDQRTTLRGASRQHLVNFVNARTVDIDTKVSGNTFSRDRTVIKGIHTWLRVTHGVELPFTLDTVMTPRGRRESMREGRGVAKAAAMGTPLTPTQIPQLQAAAWRIGPDGAFGDSSLGPRDSAVISLGIACGARAKTLNRLTIWELPPPVEPGGITEMRIPGAIVKGRREARSLAFTTHLQPVWDYIRSSRRLTLTDWMPPDPIHVVKVHNKPGRFWGITDSTGRQHSFNDLDANTRCRLVTPDGEPAVLFLSARGRPLSQATFQEITGDVSRIAEDTYRRFPHVHTHDLRHTHATHLAAVFMLGVRYGERALTGKRERLDIQSAVKMASISLGHLDEATTNLYIQQVGLMALAFDVHDFLGGR